MNPWNIDIKSSTLEKLIDIVADGIGKLSTPYLLRKIAAAKSQEILQICESIEKARTTIGSDLSIQYDGGKINITSNNVELNSEDGVFSRIYDRLLTVETERQKNLDRITLFALREAARIATPIDPLPVDKDWINRFFSMSQDVSDELMHEVWGKILAGEVNRPGSFSLRSLELLRNLSQQEAESFRQIAQYAIKVSNHSSFVFPNDACQYQAGDPMWGKIILMKELGLLNESLLYATFECNDKIPLKFQYGEKQFEVLAKVTSADLQLSAYKFTVVGSELLTLIEVAPVIEYCNCLKTNIENMGFICRPAG